MSHNIIKVGNIPPDITGNIPIEIEHIEDINIRPKSNGIAIKYVNNKWISAGKPARKNTLLSWLGHATFSSSTMTAYLYQQGYLIIYRKPQIRYQDTNAVTLNNAVSGESPWSSGTWYQSVTLSGSVLNGKKILLEALPVNRNVGGADFMRYQWVKGTTTGLSTFTSISHIGEQTQDYTQPVFTVLTMGSSDVTVGLKVESLAGSINVMSGNASLGAHHSYMQISILE